MSRIRQTRTIRTALAGVVLALAALGCGRQVAGTPSYLFVWAGAGDRKSSDFLGVIDATADSPAYGSIVASVPIDEAGTSPHHTEQEMPGNGHLLANGFGAGRTWLFDLTEPRAPKILTSFGARAGFSHPHSFVRLPNNEVLATFQYAEGAPPSAHDHGGTAAAPGGTTPAVKPPATGGLVQMSERGEVIRSASALDPAIPYPYIYPYHVLPLPAIDRAISSTTDMNDGNKPATSEWVQLWRLSDLTLLKSFALPPGSKPNRLYIVNLDPATGALSIDQRFRDAGSAVPGITLTGKQWPHGFSGEARPHGTVFSR